MRPGTNVANTTAVPPSTAPVNTGTWFTVGLAQQGPLTPVLITSFAQYQRIFGLRGTYSATYSDAVEQYFNEGGSRCYVARAVGTAATTSVIILKDSVAATAMSFSASGPGLWGNTLKLVVAGTETAFTIVVQQTVNGVVETLETSPVLSSAAEAAVWSKSSLFVIGTVTGTKSPAAGTFALATGTDENASVTTAVFETCLKRFTQELGPGQVSLPGISTTVAIEALVKIAGEQRRAYCADAPNGASKATLKTLGEAIRALANNAARPGIIDGDWQQAPALTGGLGFRSVPCSAYRAAKCAVNDVAGNPNRPPAGKNGILFGSLGKETAFTDPEVEELYLAGIMLCKVVNGQVRLYGFRTPVSPQTDPLYVQFNNIRTDMAITWKAFAIEEEYYASQIDGVGLDAANYANSLAGMLLPLYNLKALFGKTPAEAFTVDTGLDVNTLAGGAEGTLNATLAYRRTPGADQVNLNLTRVSITQEV